MAIHNLLQIFLVLDMEHVPRINTVCTHKNNSLKVLTGYYPECGFLFSDMNPVDFVQCGSAPISLNIIVAKQTCTYKDVPQNYTFCGHRMCNLNSSTELFHSYHSFQKFI